MMNYFSGIRPADSFIVHTNYVPSILSEDVLKRLYIPLIGVESVAVYQYLSQFIDQQQLSDPVTHYVIINELKMNLSRFEELRMKLEGIGLIKTYLKADDEAQQFVYKLLSPVMPTQFFNDPMLSVFLFQVVGRERYKVLKEHYSTRVIALHDYKDISKNYMDVFGTPKEPSAYVYSGNDRLIKTTESAGIPIYQETFDFDMLEMLLNQNLITRDQLPKETRELIVQLAALYDLAPVDMRRIILKSLTSNQRISHEELRKNARDFYQMEHPGELPELKASPAEVSEDDSSQLTWFELMDTTSPIEMLASLSQSEPTIRQKRMIETIMEREKLSFGVMNILLQFVMFTNEMKLPQAYIEEIASNWKKLKLDTSRKAYDYVKKMQAKQAEPKRRSREKAASYEKTPQWLTDTAKEQQPAADVDEDMEEERRKLQEQLKTFWKEDES